MLPWMVHMLTCSNYLIATLAILAQLNTAPKVKFLLCHNALLLY